MDGMSPRPDTAYLPFLSDGGDDITYTDITTPEYPPVQVNYETEDTEH